MKKIFFRYLLPLFIFFASCRNEEQALRVEKITLSNANNRQFSSNYYFDVQTEMNTTVEYQGKKTKSSNSSKIGLIYSLSTDSAGHHVLKITYDKFLVDIDKNGNKNSLNASNGSNSFDPAEAILSSIIGSSIYVTLDSNRSVINVSGNNEVSNKLAATLKDYDPSAKDLIQKNISKLLGDEFIKNNIEETLNLIPDTGVVIGSSWNKNTTQSGELTFQTDTKYTLVGLEDSLAEIEIESIVKSIADNRSPLSFGTASELSGEQGGNVIVNRTTGVLEKSKSEAVIKGTVQVMGEEVPVKIVLKKEIRRENPY